MPVHSLESSLLSSYTIVFVTGLHRSGTSLLHRCLREHPQISGFHNTGVVEDEGQHLQTVLPTHTVGEAIEPHANARYRAQWRAMGTDPRHQADIAQGSALGEPSERFRLHFERLGRFRAGTGRTGRAQSLALKIGKGRVVVLGEAAVLSAQVVKQPGEAPQCVGMTFPGSNNRQFALNIMHWLSRLLD